MTLNNIIKLARKYNITNLDDIAKNIDFTCDISIYEIIYNILTNQSEIQDNKIIIRCLEDGITDDDLYKNRLQYLLGLEYDNMGLYDKSIPYYHLSILHQYDCFTIYNNLGNAYNNIGETQKAITYLDLALEKKPDLAVTYWNKIATLTDSIQEAIVLLQYAINYCHSNDSIHRMNQDELIYQINITGLQCITNKMTHFTLDTNTETENHYYKRSYDWYINLGYQPKIIFNRYYFYDYLLESNPDIKNKPFYEYGVWYGYSFRYLLNLFPYGYGFDSFTGIPEDWVYEPRGTYSTQGYIPEFDRSEMIVGYFNESLPIFFNQPRPIASIINFDADLYSSTYIALEHSIHIIDKDTILIFDEFIVTPDWENDEYKALQDFCDTYHKTYRVIAVSFYCKMVAVKILDKL